jgi:spore coat polysaccharide biosynthesis protein SpsF (cytidylyltransferase family)/MoaA/NifB/PqqE/SkfB family radical SAM enzyme
LASAKTDRPVVAAAILARSSSPDRPGGLLTDRALTEVRGRPVLEHIVRRLGLCRNLSGLAAAVGEAGADQRIVRAAEGLGLPVVAGHPHDVLRRLLLAAESLGADHIVRINGNFPLIDPWALDELVAGHLAASADYSSNGHYQGVVYGLGAEIMAVPVLRELVEYALPGDLYSGTRLFLRRPWDFNVHLPSVSPPAPDLKACVDFAGDEKIIEAILVAQPEPDHRAVVEFFAARPEAARRSGGATEVGLSKVLLFPEKLVALKDNGPESRDLSYPVSVELSLTNRCNQQCLWCSDRDLRQRCPDRMSLDILDKLFADLARGGTRGVTIEGGGEPTISELFEPALRSALEHGLAVGLITNGLELFGPGRDPSLYRRLEWLRVSLDAADRRQYLQSKGVDGFDQVLANLGRLAELAPDITLGVGYVLTNRNDDPDHLQQLVLTLRSLEVDYLQIRPVVDHPGLVSGTDLGFLTKFSTPDFSVNLAALEENAPSGNDGRPCLAHSLSTVIGADGAVWLCGRLNTEAGARPIGGLTASAFRDIWQGPERARQTALAASPDYCRAHCPQCRMTKYNKLLYDIDRLKTRNFI